MVTKCIGSQFKAFYNDDSFWPGESWHEDATILVNGVENEDAIDQDKLEDTDIISVAGGIVYGVSKGNDPSLESHLRKWLKQQATVSMVVAVDRGKETALRDAIIAAGGKILK